MEKQFVLTRELSVTGDDLLHTLKELIHDDTVRRIVLRDGQGRSLIEIPSTLGLDSGALSPVLAAVGALAALEGDMTILVETALDEESV